MTTPSIQQSLTRNLTFDDWGKTAAMEDALGATLGIYSHVVPEVFTGVTATVNDASCSLLAGTYAPKMSGELVRKQLRQLDPLLGEGVEIGLPSHF